MASVEIGSIIELHDLADMIGHSLGLASDLAYEDIVDFFAEVDRNIGDWDFTRRVAEFFSREMDNLNKES